jgi:hypothetical protein
MGTSFEVTRSTTILADRARVHGLIDNFRKVVPMDKLIGKDFEKGLARLKAAAEAP